MKSKTTLLTILAALLLTGCALIPKKVEFGQDKVKAVPETTVKTRETQRQAALYVAEKAQETQTAALATAAAPEVILPATEATVAAGALSDSMGPPADKWQKTAEELATRLREQEAKYNAKLEAYRKDVAELVGKKVEGTGFIQMPYFKFVGLVLAGFLVLWTALKIYGTFNPVVGLGTNIVGRVGSSILQKGFEQVVGSAERFKSYLTKADLTDDEKTYIKDLLRRAQMESQDSDVQDLIKELTAAFKAAK